MSNANEQAYPAIETRPAYDDYRNLYAEAYSVGGLTKREYFAAMAMSGILANITGAGISDVADFSVQCADALLARLEGDKC